MKTKQQHSHNNIKRNRSSLPSRGPENQSNNISEVMQYTQDKRSILGSYVKNKEIQKETI